MKKLLLALVAVVGILLLPGVGSACPGHANCACAHGQAAAETTAAKDVSLEGKVVPTACHMAKAKMKKACTGAALAVGEDKHMIMKGGKGVALVKAAKGKDKTVKVKGTLVGSELTVETYEIVNS